MDAFNASRNNCETHLLGREMMLRWYIKAVFVVAYALVGVASLVGNLLVLAIIIFKRDMLSVTNVMIGSLAASDLLVTVVSLWVTPLHHYRRTWELGPVMCYLVYAVQGASLMWSPFTLTVMAVDRYLLVVCPFSRQINKKACIAMMFSIWVGALLVLSPMLFHVQYVPVDDCNQYCLEVWPKKHSLRLWYGMIVLMVRSAIPLTIIAYCHWRIAHSLQMQEERLGRSRSVSSRNQMNELQKKRRLQRLLISMVFIFALCTFPLDVFNMLQDAGINNVLQLDKRGASVAFLCVHLVAMTGTLWNPIIYAVWNENFKRHLRRAMVDCHGRVHGSLAARVNKPKSITIRGGLQSSAAAVVCHTDGDQYTPAECDKLLLRPDFGISRPSYSAILSDGQLTRQTSCYSSYTSINGGRVVTRPCADQLGVELNETIRSVARREYDVGAEVAL